LIQRQIEAAGIATISVTLSKEITKKVKPPRSIYTGLPLGHPFSFPGQEFRQLNILRFLLKKLKEITIPGTLIEVNFNESVDPQVVCETCNNNK